MSALMPVWLKGQIYTVGNDDGFSFVCAGSSGFELLLPLSLQQFEASCGAEGTRIFWNFTENITNQHVTLEKSHDGLHYHPFSCRIESKEEGYECLDPAAKSGARYYRLKLEIPDTKVEYSQAIAAVCEPLYNYVHPNPSSGLFTINIPENNVLIYITDITGKLVFQKRLMHTSEQIDITNIKSGLYNMEIRTEKGISTQRIIISK